jgi:Domain of unknown function (DUF4142)
MIGSGADARYVVAALIGMLTLPAAPARAAALPATSTDLDFVRRVHLTAAGVGTASALVRAMSVNTVVERLSQQVTTQCEQLDGLSRSAAETLRVPLDSPLPAEQQSALAALQQRDGGTFDAGYVDYLWRADSELLPIATTVKGTTRNPVVRRLADRAEAVTAAQLPMLQDSGLLRMTVLPAAASPGATDRLPGGVPMDRQLMARTRSGTGYLAPSAWTRVAVLLVASGVAGILSWRVLKRPRPGRPRARWTLARRKRNRNPAMPATSRSAGPRHRRSTAPETGRAGNRQRQPRSPAER